MYKRQRLDLGDAGLRKMVVSYPTLLGLRVERMESNCAWLQRRLGLDKTQLARVVVASPPLLYLSVEDNLAPKLEFFAREIGLSHAELREWVVKNPSTLGLSLANRYRPRLEACHAAGVDAKRVLSYATQTDETFCGRVGMTLGEFEAIIRESVSV